MKKCPFCGADIEENSQFCLYCLNSLTEKEQILIHKKKKPQGLVLLGAFAAAAMILLVLLLARKAMPDPVNPSERETISTTLPSTSTQATTEPTEEPTTEPTEEVTEPTEEETEPTQAATQPTTKPSSKPSTPPTQPTAPPTQPTAPPTQPTSPPTEPTQPTTQPTQPEEDPTQPETHLHSFHLKYTTEEFLKSAATCENPAYYYYSCTCGQKSEDTFPSGKPNGHSPAVLKGYPADCLNNGKTDGSYCSVCQVVLQKQKEIYRSGHAFPFSTSLSPCMTCGEMGTFTISCPPLPVYYKDIFRVNSGYFTDTLLDDGVTHGIEIILNYTNISSQTTNYFPIFMGGLHRYDTLEPNESGHYMVYSSTTNPNGSFSIEFDWD